MHGFSPQIRLLPNCILIICPKETFTNFNEVIIVQLHIYKRIASNLTYDFLSTILLLKLFYYYYKNDVVNLVY